MRCAATTILAAVATINRAACSVGRQKLAPDSILHDVVRYDNIMLMSTIGRRSGKEEDGTSLATGVKTLLARRIVGALDRQGLTVREAESRTGNAAADFSRLRQGQLERFSIERLLDMASRLISIPPGVTSIWRWSSGHRGATDRRTSTSNSRRRWNVWWGVRSTW
jgi:hypothetical protein